MTLTDLKIIDELLCDIKQRENLTWEQLEDHSNITRYAMGRLREAWCVKFEMDTITLGLSEYFNRGF